MKVKEDSLIVLYDLEDGKKHYVSLKSSKEYGTEKGIINLSEVVDKEFGSIVKTHKGHPYKVLPCTLYEFIMHKLRRFTQIVYPKDAVYIAFRLDVKPGDLVIECGTGSGAMTLVFARYVGKEGKVVSYERRKEFAEKALENLKIAGLEGRVEIKEKDISEGFDEKNADAVFLDVREPWLYVDKALESLKVGKFLGVLVPTANQVIEVLKAFESFKVSDVEVSEILLRKYKPVPERLRPEDTMSAHTAFLIFGRKV